GRVPPYQIRKIEHHCFVFEHPYSAGPVDKLQSSNPWNGLITEPGDDTSADIVTKRLELPRHSPIGCGCHLGYHDWQNWRGWMGIEPTQDASTAPRKRF